MTVDELRRAVRSLPGVTTAEVTETGGESSMVRVWTDGTRPDVEIRRDVEDLAARFGLHPVSTGGGVGRRSGLGRGLGETLSAASEAPDPSHMAVVADEERPGAGGSDGRLVKLAIEETSDAVEVRAVDEAGREFSATVGPGSDGLTNAVASAVSLLRGFPPPAKVVVNTRDVDGSTVVTVLVEMSSGRRAAGASIVTGGLPFTVARAVDGALSGL